MKIIYTESALQEMQNFQEKQQQLFIEEKKSVFGDDFLEITASDIKEASNKIKISKSTSIYSI